jgi:hypothetical protein
LVSAAWWAVAKLSRINSLFHLLVIILPALGFWIYYALLGPSAKACLAHRERIIAEIAREA